MFISEEYVNSRFASLYYKEPGQGISLIMLHGNDGSYEIFSRLAGLMNRYYRMILMDSRSHGASYLEEGARARELTTSGMAEDVVQVMEVLHMSQTVILSFSDGVNAALETTSQYPDKVLVVVAVSDNALPRGVSAFFYVQVRARYALQHVAEKIPLADSIKERTVVDRQLSGLMAHWPGLTRTQLSRTQAPVLTLTGHHDLIRPCHSLWMGEQIMDVEVVFIKGADRFTFLKKEKTYAGHIVARLREKGL